MAEDLTITSANSVVTLAVAGLFDSPQQLQGYMADRAFENAAVDTGEFVRGVDGILSAGWVPYNSSVTVALMPDSLSSVLFETWVEAERVQRVKLLCQLTIDLPSTQRRYSCVDGRLSNAILIPPALRVLGGRPFGMIFDHISPSPL